MVRRLLGLSYFMNDDYEKAVQVLRPFLADLPDEPGLLYALGTSLVRSGSVEQGRFLLVCWSRISGWLKST